MPYAESAMPRCVLGIALILGTFRPTAHAQQTDAEFSDEELIRWAARVVGQVDGRTVGEHPPVPPDSYVRSGTLSGIPNAGDEEDAARLLAELTGGALGLLVAGGAGALLVWAASEGDASPDGMAIAVGAATIAGALGLAAGVTLAADLAGGRGNFGHAFLGLLLGAAASLPLVALGFSNDSPVASMVAAGLLPLAGAVLGYEVGHSERARGTSTVAYLTPSNGGVQAGVAGSLP